MTLRQVNITKYGYNILQVETSSSCNLGCAFCPYPLRNDQQSILPVDEVRKIIDSIVQVESAFKYICFSQFNEPLLDYRIFDFIKYAKEKNLPVLLITNGTLF